MSDFTNSSPPTARPEDTTNGDPFDSTPSRAPKSYQYSSSGTKLFSSYSRDGLLSSGRESSTTSPSARDGRSDVSGDLRQKARNPEREYREVERDDGRASTTSKPSYATNGSGTSAATANLASPAKPAAPSSRRSRNQPSGRVHDIEFATEISTSLLGQVRNLQNILAERDEALKTAMRENAKLQADNENFTHKMRGVDEHQNRFKEANWNLETRIQNLQAQMEEASARELRLTQNLNSTKSERSALEREHDEVRRAHGKLADDHASLQRQYDLDLLGMRRNLSSLEDEREDLQQKLEELINHNQELQRAVAYRSEAHQDGDGGQDALTRDATMLDFSTPKNSPPASPVKATPRHAALETETVKSSLNHAHRMIQTLKANVNREKSEKSELKRMLQDARDELESRRADGGLVANAGKKRRPNVVQDVKRPGQSGKLGALGRTQEEITNDPNWEDEDSQFARSRGAKTDERGMSADDTDAFYTGVESMHDEEDDLTETEDNHPRRLPLGSRPPLVTQQSTASDDEYDLTTPHRGDLPRFKLKLNRGGVNRSFESSDMRDSPASVASGGSRQGGGLNLAAELEDFDPDESSFADSTTSRATASHFTRVNGAATRETTPLSPVSSHAKSPVSAPRIMVDSGMLTEPWTPAASKTTQHIGSPMSPTPAVHSDSFPLQTPASSSRSVHNTNFSPSPIGSGTMYSPAYAQTPMSLPAVSRETSQVSDSIRGPVYELPAPTTTVPRTATLQMSSISSLQTVPTPAVTTPPVAPTSFQTITELPSTILPAPVKMDAMQTPAGTFFRDDDKTNGLRKQASLQQLPPVDLGMSLPSMMSTPGKVSPQPTSSMAFVDEILHRGTQHDNQQQVALSTPVKSISEVEASPVSTDAQRRRRGVIASTDLLPGEFPKPPRSSPLPPLDESLDQEKTSPSEARALIEPDLRIDNRITTSKFSEPTLQFNAAPYDDDSRIPLKPISGNTDPRRDLHIEKTVRALTGATTDEGTQTVVSADLIDQIMRERKGKATLASLSPYSTGSPKARTSSTSSRTDIGTELRQMRRSPNASSFRKGAISPPPPELPPLPSDHKEVIAAATSRNSNVPGAMGPPAVPAQVRPRTPTGGTASVVSSSRYRSRSAAGRSDVTSPTPRRSSVSSFASELDERFNMVDPRPMHVRASGNFRLEEDVDPRMIQAITQTMIGEFLWKYTRRAGRSGHSNNRHKRFFWIHPYTRTLYWSVQDPAGGNGTTRTESQAKSVGIEAIKVVSDDNQIPPGLHPKSIVVVTSGRSIKFTAPTAQRHETWFNALSYLLLRNTADDNSVHGMAYSGKAGSITGSARGRPATITSINSDDLAEFNAGMPRPISRATIASNTSVSSIGTRTTNNVGPNGTIRPGSAAGPAVASIATAVAGPSTAAMLRTASPQGGPAYGSPSQIPSLAVRQSQAAAKRSGMAAGPSTEFASSGGAGHYMRAASPSQGEGSLRAPSPIMQRAVSPLQRQVYQAQQQQQQQRQLATVPPAAQTMAPPPRPTTAASTAAVPVPVTPQNQTRLRPMSMQTPSPKATAPAVTQSARPGSAASGRLSSLASRFRSSFSSRSRTERPPSSMAQRQQGPPVTALRNAAAFDPNSSVGSTGTVINRSAGGRGDTQVENVRACCDG